MFMKKKNIKENLAFKVEGINTRNQTFGKLFWEKSRVPYFEGNVFTDLASAQRVAIKEKAKLVLY